MDLVSIATVVMVLANGLFAGILYGHSRRQVPEVLYALITVFAGLWAVGVLLMGVPNAPPALFLLGTRLHYVAGNLAYLCFFWFALIQPPRSTAAFHWPAGITAANLFIQLLVVLPLGLFLEIRPAGPFEERLAFQPLGYWLFVASLVLVFLLTEALLLRKLPRMHGTERNAIRYLIIGSLLAGSFGIVFNLILPWFGRFELFILGPVFVTSAFVGMSIYNLIRFRLFNVRVVAAEVFVIVLLVTFLFRFADITAGLRLLLNIATLLLSAAFGYLLIRSVMREVRDKERISELARELASANAELKRLDQAKSEFISIAGHQLRAPLTVIKGYVSMFLEGSLGPASDSGRESMKKVFVSTEQLVRLVGDLLDLSRIEAGQLKYDFRKVFLADVVAEVMKELEITAKAKGLAFVHRTIDTRRSAVQADPDKIREVVMNLLDNAIKYTASGWVNVELIPEERGGRKRITLAVTDSGIGITAADLGKMFTKFARTEEAKRLRPDGMGLGLYIVKKIIEDHGGRVSVTSRGLGQGSTFSVALPAL